MLIEIAEAVRHLEAKMDQRFTALDGRLSVLDSIRSWIGRQTLWT